MQLYILDTEGFFHPRLAETLKKSGANFHVNAIQSLSEIKATHSEAFALINPACLMPGKTIKQSLLDDGVSINFGVLSDPLPFDWVQRLLKDGAVGYFPKNMEVESLAQAILFSVQTGQFFLPIDKPDRPSYYMQRVGVEDVTKQAVFTPNNEHRGSLDIDFDLSKREKQVAEKLVEGLTNQQIATALDIKEVTVKQHASAIFKKLNVDNRTQASRLLLPFFEKRRA